MWEGVRKRGGDMPAKKRRTHGHKIYSETRVAYGYWLVAFLGVCLWGLVGYGIYVNSGNVNWTILWWILLLTILTILTLYAMSFSIFKISATTSAITVRLGMFKRVVPWEDIIDCHAEIMYEWSGIQPYWRNGNIESSFLEVIFPIVRSRRKLIYRFHNWDYGIKGGYGSGPRKIGRHHVVLRLRRGEIKEFSFPTRKQKTLVGVIQGQIGKQVTQETVV